MDGIRKIQKEENNYIRCILNKYYHNLSIEKGFMYEKVGGVKKQFDVVSMEFWIGYLCLLQIKNNCFNIKNLIK